jgi:hypothetical protein
MGRVIPTHVAQAALFVEKVIAQHVLQALWQPLGLRAVACGGGHGAAGAVVDLKVPVRLEN